MRTLSNSSKVKIANNTPPPNAPAIDGFPIRSLDDVPKLEVMCNLYPAIGQIIVNTMIR
ncbi:hypothetical protein [Clostridium sp. ZS6]|uniref:hypothetical protein n=1 Tax=Clostridium sp. ZS6 TaxID=2949987 RepID=UPI00207AFE43|nr:hypothetical protein [Clostridium sp. ZS6]